MNCNVALIGFGEASSTFARAAEWRGRANAWDIDRHRLTSMKACEVNAADSAAAALTDAPIILSLVSADQAVSAALDCAPLLTEGALWCDMNSVSPDSKRAAAQVIEAHGASYIDCAILAPVSPSGLKVPILLAGEEADRAASALRTLKFANVSIVGTQVGRASTIKMVRSVMIKGVEALTDEMMEAAAAAGVVAEVLASLDTSNASQNWAERADYNLERMATHGARRAAEMEECARTLTAIGVDPIMTIGTAERQRRAATTGAGL